MIVRKLSKGVVVLILLLAWIWGGFALYLSGPGLYLLNVLLVWAFGMVLPVAFILSPSFSRGVLVCIMIFTILITWWQTLTPSGDKDWAPDVAQISHGEIQGGKLTMRNVRNFEYKDENTFKPHWETRTYDLDKLEGLDLFLSYWASDHIAHTILSWDFGKDGNLAISIETRKDKTQEYSAIKGFFKQFELAYIAADEEDIIRLRTNYRKERVYLYRLQAPIDRVRSLLESYLSEMNKLVDAPQFYNALTRNCTTTIQIHADSTRSDAPPPLDWRLIASGHVDGLLYDRGVISNERPFKELRVMNRIDLKMQQEKKENFSVSMRKDIGLPDTVN